MKKVLTYVIQAIGVLACLIAIYGFYLLSAGQPNVLSLSKRLAAHSIVFAAGVSAIFLGMELRSTPKPD